MVKNKKVYFTDTKCRGETFNPKCNRKPIPLDIAFNPQIAPGSSPPAPAPAPAPKPSPPAPAPAKGMKNHDFEIMSARSGTCGSTETVRASSCLMLAHNSL